MSDGLIERLSNTLGNVMHNVVLGKFEEKYSARIPDNRIFRAASDGELTEAPLGGEFKPNQTYFQVLIHQLFTTYNRQLWVQREHLGAVWMSFRYDGALRSVPYLVGRELLLDKVKSLPAGAQIEFRDVRVGSVYPYTGDSLALYVGLWSTPTVDWATTTFSALDTIAGKVKVAGSLSEVLDMLDVLNQGISAVLGLKDIQAHLNLYQEFHPDASGGESALRPGYFVMIDAPRVAFDPSTLRVIDGRLFVEHDGQAPLPMVEHSFMLYSIRAQTQLDVAVDLFGSQYDAVLNALIGSKSDPTRLAQAAHEYHVLQTRIVTNADLTRADRLRLIAYFGESLNSDAVMLAVNVKDAGVSFAPGMPRRLPAGLRRPNAAEFRARGIAMEDDPTRDNPIVAAETAVAAFRSNLEAARQ